MSTTAAAIPRTAPRRRLYVGLALLAIAMAAAGFSPTYFGPLLAGSVDKPAFIHFHAAVYVGWLALFLTQAALAASGRVVAHMRLGRFAAGYGVLVVVAGLIAALGMFTLRVRAGSVAEAQGRLLGPLVDMAVFTPLFLAALYNRRKPELHKRFMIVATCYLLIAAVGRMTFIAEPRNLFLFQLVWVTPLLLAMVHDFVRQRRVHPVYVAGLALFLLTGPAVRAVARGSEAWRTISGWLVPWVS
jgi:hypothetical protein